MKTKLLKRIVTVKCPLKSDWEFKEYLRCRNEADDFNLTDRDPSKVLCSFCPKEITTPSVHVVEYGHSVACDSCFKARYAKRRQLFKHIPVPPDLQVDGAAPETDEELKARQVGYDESIAEAHGIQENNVTQIRQGFSKVDSADEPVQS